MGRWAPGQESLLCRPTTYWEAKHRSHELNWYFKVLTPSLVISCQTWLHLQWHRLPVTASCHHHTCASPQSDTFSLSVSVYSFTLLCPLWHFEPCAQLAYACDLTLLTPKLGGLIQINGCPPKYTGHKKRFNVWFSAVFFQLLTAVKKELFCMLVTADRCSRWLVAGSEADSWDGSGTADKV